MLTGAKTPDTTYDVRACGLDHTTAPANNQTLATANKSLYSRTGQHNTKSAAGQRSYRFRIVFENRQLPGKLSTKANSLLAKAGVHSPNSPLWNTKQPVKKTDLDAEHSNGSCESQNDGIRRNCKHELFRETDFFFFF